ncbi:hypothetical protein D210916BOD24_27420 [Alteromonas sp. D210916BOD_24]
MASFLSQHPDIYLVDGKEAHVFDDPAYHNALDKQRFAEQKYESKLKHYKGERYILDATPITMLHPAFITAASSSCPDAKYIVMLRNPIERALSHYAMTKSRGLEPCSPAKAFLLEHHRMKGFYPELPFAPFESKYRDQSYLIRGRYNKQLSYLYNVVPRQNVYIEQQKRLSENHDTCLLRIFNFLGLPNISVEKKEVFKSSNQYHLPMLMRLYLRLLFKVYR